MKHRIIVFGIAFFVLSVLGKDFASAGIQLWYQVNKEAIAQEHCVNKDKPEMKCDGKCYLTKQLAKVENTPANGEKTPKNQLKLKSLHWIAEKASHSEIVLIVPENSIPGNSAAEFYSSVHTDNTFHPPCI